MNGLLDVFTSHALSWMTFFPLIGIAVILLLPRGKDDWVKYVSVIATAVPLLLGIYVYTHFNVLFDGRGPGGELFQKFQFQEGPIPWIESFNIDYFMGIDGLSVPMVLLTALLGFICIFASWGIDRGVKGYFSLFLLLETGMMGTFCALDFFLFFIFWEVMLLPMYFLIGIWGAPPRKEADGRVRGGPYAAIKFFLYTLLGSALMLVAMLALYFVDGQHTFSIPELIAHSAKYTMDFQIVIWVMLFIGFAIKVPIFPFHTWLPDAHVEAPTAISVILAGVLLKMGTYGILRFNYPILPDATKHFLDFLAILGVINILYGALCAMAQKDLKKLVAYSSISHMGYVLLGMAAMTPQGLNGALLQMFNHGTITAMLFLCVGVIYDRAHHRRIDGFGGLASKVPVYTAVTAFAFFGGMALPGLSSFISEVLVYLGAFQKYPIFVVIGAISVVLTAGYLLWALQRMFLGKLNPKYEDLPDINARELFTLIPLAIIVLILGVYPFPVLNLMEYTMNMIAQSFH